ncbi:DNA-binding transcriptional MerR regulator [Thermolongibacillus altinsuensis]|jgi:DNA-binding transcriptional MerR regulator|uniref:DNA-binding transcriptional MerR regulator n=1 Tax=Thermolongibacillus altinsuensis TaxID=575256 RepID=A0A4R1QF42_9BACL|nr:MerR family transcriptional regulator [Thermolongibacillus altinsuensis]TCL49701.1 DNA-binding transcriptional MerR regulator [Thermolongibacillus altinsuensis]GMB09612.1 HTH-type transcriptional activator mta [Thermolongibacillus altinsuensis]
MHYKVKEVADMAGISVRTLHHYDQIGLLVPDTITPSGYRLYSEQNLERLQQILFFKEMGFRLQEIKHILDHPHFDRKKALQAHREMLIKKKERLEEMIKTVEKTIQSIEGGIQMEKKEMFKGFDMREIEEHQKKYAQEAREKYGKEMVEKVEQRTSTYTKEDWATIKTKTEEIYNRIIARMEYGPEDAQVQEAVAEWRQLITDYFYECTLDIFRGLGDLYVNDERFTKNIDQFKKGLAAFLREAIHVYCDRHKSE